MRSNITLEVRTDFQWIIHIKSNIHATVLCKKYNRKTVIEIVNKINYVEYIIVDYVVFLENPTGSVLYYRCDRFFSFNNFPVLN